MPLPPPPAAALTSTGSRSAAAVGHRRRGRHDRDACRDRDLAGRVLAPHRSITSADGPTNTRPASSTRSRERRALGQEAVAGMDGVGAGGLGGGDDGVDVEVGLGDPRSARSSAARTCGASRSSVGVDRDACAMPSRRAGPHHPQRRSRRGWRRGRVSNVMPVTSGRRRRRAPGPALRRRGQAQAEHPTGVDRVDDAVVPEPRGRVVRRALGLVLVADRRLEGLLVLADHSRRVPRCRRGGPWRAPTRPAPRPSPRSGRSATSTGTAGRRRGRTSRSCRHRTSRR